MSNKWHFSGLENVDRYIFSILFEVAPKFLVAPVGGTQQKHLLFCFILSAVWKFSSVSDKGSWSIVELILESYFFFFFVNICLWRECWKSKQLSASSQQNSWTPVLCVFHERPSLKFQTKPVAVLLEKKIWQPCDYVNRGRAFLLLHTSKEIHHKLSIRIGLLKVRMCIQ